jgi:hypothetical protein
MRPKLETLNVGGELPHASVATAHAKEHYFNHIAVAVVVLVGIAALLYVVLLQLDFAHFRVKVGSMSQIAATIAALASIGAALYTQLFLGPITRRKSDADNTFSSEVGPWLDEARRKYVKEKLSGGDIGKL